MNVTLLKALVALVPAGLLLFGSIILFLRSKALYSFMQVLGAGCLVMVVLTHVCEAAHWFPGMQWGLEHSTGHYLDLVCALLGVAFFPAGYLFHACAQR